MDFFILLVGFILGAVLLAVGQWIFSTVSIWRARRSQRLGRKLSTIVLVDDKRPWRRRTCFWTFALKSPEYELRNRARVKLFSISNELDRKRNPAITLFSSEKTDVIVVNWDAINRDPVYGSDRSYSFLDHYRPDMFEWLSRGGVLLVESQGASWATAQMPYDCFTNMFPNSYVHVSLEMWTLGNRASIPPDHAKHPPVADLSEADFEMNPGGLWARKPWFPKRVLNTDVESLRFARRHQQHLYRGWFDEWSDDWIPIIVPRGDLSDPMEQLTSDSAKNSKRAIALIRPVHKSEGPPHGHHPETGFVILTTMFIASSELLHFTSNVLALPEWSDRQ